MQPSKYQSAVYDWIGTGRGSAVIAATAGSGKTTTIIEAASRASGRRIFLAFSKAIAEELSRRLPPDVPASTIHSAGYAALRQSSRVKYRVDSMKQRDIARDVLDEMYGPVTRQDDADEREMRRDDERALVDMLDKCRLTLTDVGSAAALADVAAHYGILASDNVMNAVSRAMRRGERAAERGQIDFVDMLWLPVIWKLQPAQYDWLLLDECQDVSPVQLALVRRMLAPGGRMVAVGDRWQSIFGFAGADPDSVDRIIAAMEATELPLTICYRCPRSHIELARSICPTIEPADDAPEGNVYAISEAQLPAVVRNGDLIICRTNAPLVSMCIRLIAARVPARVRGRDVGKTLVTVVQDIAGRPGYSWQTFGQHLDEYRQRQQAKASRRRDADSFMESVEDRIAGIVAVAEGYDSKSADDLCTAIAGLFADDSASVWLSSVHKAKGLEAPRVFIMRPDKLPLARPNMQPWEQQQETHLLFVALTRCLGRDKQGNTAGYGALTFVSKDGPDQPDADELKA